MKKIPAYFQFLWNFYNNKISKNKIILAVVISIIVIVIVVIRVRNNSNFELSTVSKGNITQEISATGKINPATKIKLQFKNSGKLTVLNVKVGNKTLTGKILAQQDSRILNAQLSEIKAQLGAAKAQLTFYKAQLDAQLAKFDELKRGTREEEIIIQEIKVENAEIALNDAKINFIDNVQDAYTKSDDVVKNKIDQFFKNPISQSPKLTFSVIGLQLQSDIEFERLSVGYVLSSWNNSIPTIDISTDLISESMLAKNNLNKIKKFLDNIAFGINNPDNEPTNISKSTFNNWKTDVSTARTIINTAISNISIAGEKFKTAESNLILAENELALKRAGTAKEQIRAQEAQVKQAEANISIQKSRIKEIEASLRKINAQIQDMIIYSPVNGVITEVNGSVGETITSDKIVVSIIPNGKLQIDVNISESDIINVNIGQDARVTIDAFGDNIIFKGKVVQIEPAETIVGSSIYYKTTVVLDEQGKNIKPGMTANIWIKIASKTNVLVISAISVKEKSGVKFVEIYENGNIKQKEIKTGLRSANGTIEIISGLKEGEKVIVSKPR